MNAFNYWCINCTVSNDSHCHIQVHAPLKILADSISKHSNLKFFTGSMPPDHPSIEILCTLVCSVHYDTVNDFKMLCNLQTPHMTCPLTFECCSLPLYYTIHTYTQYTTHTHTTLRTHARTHTHTSAQTTPSLCH